MILVTQFYIEKIRPWLLGLLTRILYSGGRVHFGKNFRAEGIPKIIINKDCKLAIGDNVLFRRSIEIRVHKHAEIVIGSNSRIDRGVRLLATNESILRLEEGVRIGLYTVLNGGDNITIGKESLVSGFVYIQTSMHNHSSGVSIQNQGFAHKEITLGNDVWIGTHAVILPGCILGDGVVVGSNAVVNKSFDSETVVAGVPARELKRRTQ